MRTLPRRWLAAGPMFVLYLMGCDETPRIPLHFDGPIAAAWLDESDDLPFNRPIGFVANSRSGTIIPLDLKAGRLLTDDSTASFLRAGALATGQTRQLGDVVAFAKGGVVTVWALDVGSDRVLQVPYITAVEDDEPIEVVPKATEPTFVDGDGSGDAPTMGTIGVRNGFTTTEDWSIEFDGTRWWAKGSRSGTQATVPTDGDSFISDKGEVEFMIEGAATAGDRFDFHTETGIMEFAYAGRVAALFGDSERLYVAVEGDSPLIGVVDAFTGEWLGSVALPAGSSPWRMSRATDGRLFVADSRSPAVHIISAEIATNPTLATSTSLTTAAPLVDVAWQAGEGIDGVPFEHLFVAPVGLQRVDVYDLTSAAWVDPNPDDSEVAGVLLGSPVAGLAPSVGDVWFQQATAWGAIPRLPTVIVSTQDGYVFQLDASTGCGMVSTRGPHGPNEVLDTSESFLYSYLEDQGAPSDASLLVDDATGEQIAVSACGGVARGETWTITYESAAVSWSVVGSLSGEQLGRAYSDQRYVSDNGGISFLIASGSAPATDGDRFIFNVDRGLSSYAGTDVDEDGLIGTGDSPWEAPGRPLAFELYVGPTGGGWDLGDRREFAIIPAESSDVVGRLFLDAAKSTVSWD